MSTPDATAATTPSATAATPARAPRATRRARLVATAGLILAVALPVANLSLFGREVTIAASNMDRSSWELSEVINARYVERIDVEYHYSPYHNDFDSRVNKVYVDLKERPDCTVLDENSNEPTLSCTAEPKPTLVTQ